MKLKSLLISSLMLLSAGSAWADVEINETNFPDANFRSWVLNQSYGTDGILTDNEIAGVTSINVSSNYVKNMQGIEFFTALTNLDCSYNQLTSLDVSKNTALTILNCNGNKLTSLDLHNCTALKTLEYDDNELKSLDLHELTALENLVCSRNKVTALDLSNNTALTTLDCSLNYLSALDLSNNTALITLKCTSYGQLFSLDLSRNTALTELDCNNTSTLKALNVSGCTELRKLDCHYCNLQQLDVSDCVSLTDLWCEDNSLKSLNVSGCIELALLQCNNNNLQQLDVSGCRALRHLSAQYNALTSLCIAGCVSLDRVDIYRNQIKGKEMDCLVGDLPMAPVGGGDLVMSRPNTGAGDSGYEGNEMTRLQVAVAKAKGWRPAYDGSYGFPGVEYEGTGGSGETVYIETDVTSQFPTDYQGWHGATGYTATEFAPMVTTNDGRNVQVCEMYDGSRAATGTVFYRTLTGLANGTYRIELYGAASSTKGRDTDISSDMTADNEGDMTAVYLYATTPSGTVKQYIPVHWATSFSEVATAVLNDVKVTDGEVTIGMYSDKFYTNWHVVQIKGVTATADALIIYAKTLANAQTALTTNVNITGIERETLSQTIIDNTLTGEQSAEVYQAAINALESATKTFVEAKEAYDAFVAAKSTVADRSFPYASAEKKSAAESSLAASASSAADAESKAKAMLTNFRQYAESSAMLEGLEGSIDMTSYIKNPKAESAIVSSEWQTVLGDNSGGSLGIRDDQPWTDGSGNTTHKYFDGGDWGAWAWDVTFQQEITLSAGKYQLTAIGRSSNDVNLTLFAGNNTVEMSHIGAAGGLFNLGWEQNSVEFELADEGTVKIGVRGVTSLQYNWMSFSDFRLVKFPDATIESVIAKIDAIGTVVYTDACKALIDVARAAYNALTNAQKALVNAEKLKVLTDAEAEYETLMKAAEDQAAAAAVIAKIDAIGTVEYTDACKALIDAAREAYNAMTNAQKALVNAEKLQVLTDAEAEYESLKKAAEDQAAAAAVIAKIDAIGTVEYTDVCKALIDAAREAYDVLSDVQKTLVTNYNVLTAAEQVYADLAKAFAVLTYKLGEQSTTRMTVKKGSVMLDIAVEECWAVETLTVNGTDKKDDFVEGKLTVSVDADTEVSVTFGWADINNLYTEDVATGIATIEGENVKVYVNEGQICVDGAAGKLVRLYTVGGQFIMSVTPSEGMTGKFSVPAGTYIVQVGSKAARVIVK